MRLPVRHQTPRVLAALGLVSVLMLPIAAPVAAADPVVLRVGTVQSLDSINPYLTEYFIGYEIFALNYDLLVDYGPNMEPAPGYAESWTQDGTTWTFKIRPDMKWSDGQPATSEDARWLIQTLLDGQKKDGYVGAGYLDPYLTYAGVTAVTAPDPQTLVLTTATPNTQILTSYLPILPKHIWEKRDLGADPNDAPNVGTGPYQVAEWKTGEYVRMVRNPNYWGPKGYEDEVFFQFFKNEGAMTEALKAGDIDYARNVTSDQFDSLKGLPDIVTVESSLGAEANAFTQLNFNTYSKPIKDGGASTKALQDPVFRDALGYAIDKQALVDKVLGGHGLVGSTIIPPAMAGGKWHLDPPNPRTFDIDLAKSKLDAAGYKLDANGKRLDKEGKPINLRMVVPNGSTTYSASAEFITGWWKELGIDMTTQALDNDAVTALETPPEGDPPGKADFDVVIWNWAGDVDPNSLLAILTTSSIGSNSDTFFSNKTYDDLMLAQGKETDPAKRKALVDQMQQLVYDQAPYHVLFYDAALHAYRTDKFGGWTLQPTEGGLPFFAYGARDYSLLTAPEPAATPVPSLEAPASATPGSSTAAGGVASPAPSPAPSNASSGTNTPLLLGGLALVVVAVVVVIALRRGRSTTEEE
jgi:peptide/nickel transport system substrate-binding protein